MSRPGLGLGLVLLMGSGCPSTPTDPSDGTDISDATDLTDDTDGPVLSVVRTVTVTLDGQPAPGATVIQGGRGTSYLTDAQGKVVVTVDRTVRGDIALIASHPEARIVPYFISEEPTASITISLTRFDPQDNPEFTFQDPGEPTRRDNTRQCGHCHLTLNDDWFESPHRTSASNPVVHDVYGGSASNLAQSDDCGEAGGVWTTGPTPGGGEGLRCYVGPSVLSDLDPSCAEPPCAETTSNTGGCADCHAPGIDGQLGGRGMHEAQGFAYDYGVHCDVCHRVESVHLDDPNAGVAGALDLLRPSDPSATPQFFDWEPLHFGPNHDQASPRMGSVQRDHYKNGQICAGCHELHQPALVPGTALDTNRWPDGRLPVHTTWTEWERGPFADTVPCNACHMPPAPQVMNSADLQLFIDNLEPGTVAGWIKPPGTVKHHSWIGPRTPQSQMLPLSAAVDLSVERQGRQLIATVVTSNVGAGHRIPTGEPSRSMVLKVNARCGDIEQAAIGGDVVPLFVGAVASKAATEDWTTWPDAAPGDVLRVLTQDGWTVYDGFGPFGDGTLTGAAAGLPKWAASSQAIVTAVDGAGVVTLDGVLGTGDMAVLARPSTTHAGADAGAPGFAFARVLTDPTGRAMVPHHLATDVASDNRLAPHEAFTTTHTFDVDCAEPTVSARLMYRSQPWWLATEKGWDNAEILVQEATR